MQKSLYIIFVFFIFLSCKNTAQENNNTKKDSLISKNKAIVSTDAVLNENKFTVFEIDSVPDIKGKNEKSASFIKSRLEKLIGRSMKEKCEEIGIKYPPNFVLYRAFKHEKEFEIWAGNNRTDTLKLLATIPICAVDNIPGPKLQRGDGKTPEGYYNCSMMYGSSYGFMWIKLNYSEIDNFGVPQNGSSFKLFADYPYQIDKNRTRKHVGAVSPGGEICLHGNCVTAGCISFENRNFLPVFLTSAHHNKKYYGHPKIHIFPFRFTQELKIQQSKKVTSNMKSEDLINFWDDIELGYKLFNKTHKAIKVTFSGNKYNFVTY